MRRYTSEFLLQYTESNVRNHGMARLKHIFKQR